MSDPWADQYASEVSNDSCIACQKPTQSHAVLMDYDEEIDELYPVSELDNALVPGRVCHTCYREHDGVAEAVVAEYQQRLRALCEQMGTTLREFVLEPENVSAPDREEVDVRDADEEEIVAEAMDALAECKFCESRAEEFDDVREVREDGEFAVEAEFGCPECGAFNENRVDLL